MTPPPEEHKESWVRKALILKYDELIKKYKKLVEANEALQAQLTASQNDCQTLQNDIWRLQDENERLKKELEQRVEPVNEPQHGGELMDEILERNLEFQKQIEFLKGQRDDLERTAIGHLDQIEQHEATIIGLGNLRERLHQYEHPNYRNETDGEEDPMTSLANRTANLQHQPGGHISTSDIAYEKRLKELQDEQAREKASHEATRRELHTSASDIPCEKEFKKLEEELAREKASHEALRTKLNTPTSNTPCEEQLKQLRYELAREQASHDDDREELERRGNARALLQTEAITYREQINNLKEQVFNLKDELKKLKEQRRDGGYKERCRVLEEKLFNLKEEMNSTRNDGGCRERCKALEERLCRLARSV
jgi:chromosome segregation ATPase